MAETYIEYMALGDLLDRRHPENPKQHDIGAIIKSYQRFGYVSPGTIDETTGKFLSGHGRTEALQMMKQQGMDAPERIDVREDDWYVPTYRGVGFGSAMDVKAYLIADNRLTALGDWDNAQLLDLLQDLAGEDQALLETTGYDLDDIDVLLRELNPLAPDAFPEYDENIETEYCCPKCHYEWSGAPK